MTCGPLPASGLSTNAGLLLTVALACLVVGGIAVLLTRRGHRAPAATALLVLLATGTTVILIGWQAPSQPAASGCSSASNLITVIQTSTMTGLAPGIAPVPITGRLVNRSDESTLVTTVDVQIASITTRSDSSPGRCDASDYRLTHPRMPVQLTLDPGSGAPFAGAFIVFANKPSNQDACQGAVIHLLYTVNGD